MRDVNQIVIIDDNKIDCFINQKICSLAFKASNITTFNSSVAALDYFKETSINQEFFEKANRSLILLDINMPILNGFNFLKQLATLKIFIKHPIDVFFLSSSINEKDISEALNFDFCTGYINKPLTKDKLIEALDTECNNTNLYSEVKVNKKKVS